MSFFDDWGREWASEDDFLAASGVSKAIALSVWRSMWYTRARRIRANWLWYGSSWSRIWSNTSISRSISCRTSGSPRLRRSTRIMKVSKIGSNQPTPWTSRREQTLSTAGA